MTTTQVPVVGTGFGDDPRRPDLPEGVGYSVISDNGSTMTVELTNPVAVLEAEVAELKAALTALLGGAQ
jgi:hypothetical protein